MNEIFYGAIMGLLGSFHCIGMCGPLVLSIHKGNRDIWQQSYYHIGKLTSYILIGFIFGLLSSSLHLFLSQQKLSIIVGLSFLIYFIFQSIQPTPSSPVARISVKISNFLFKYQFKHPFLKYFTIGLGNGFLPCGLVYTAAVASVASGHIEQSILFMIGFGLGTIPSLTGIQLIFQLIPEQVKVVWNSMYRYLILIVGILLIMRGLNLGIPYLSPAYDLEKEEIHSCCHK